ncbi:nucleotide-binding protein [Punctularia strigosozonata HHB-11173 SS5]|uniref:nucleotide-binding protein n=1 Tax=Punctularia strigosozonata (strain HHB-11173) TaxID=741275 RepID=UPI00044164A8|nr:nucleotide-binding protein [Punctularia strigosozonata HHB-11173 SS5]EIN13618.1 nucleotide-binding protein [Punctularia strigosozonata HHB-11173 SS5]
MTDVSFIQGRYSVHRRVRLCSVLSASSPYLNWVPNSRVSITNYRGEALLDCFVQPTQHITDYRTAQTGLQAEHLYGPHALPLNQVKALVAQRIAGKIIIGHSLWNFLSVLELPHPAINTRDVALFLPFRRTLQRHSLVSLPTLMHGLMRREMSRLPQEYEHPLEQARAALDLFRSSQTVWETSVSSGAWPCALPPSAYARFFT